MGVRRKQKKDKSPPAPTGRQAARPAIEMIRVECLKAAVELRTGTTQPAGVIEQAREFEAYVTGEPPADAKT